MAENPNSEPGTITGSQAAKLLMMTPQRIGQLVAEGAIPPPIKRNAYSLVGVVQGYIRWLRDEDRRSSKVQADSDLRRARQREIEMRTAIRLGQLIDFDDVEAWATHAIATFRARLEGMPAAITRDLEMRSSMERYIDSAIEGFRQSFKDAAERLKRGDDPMGIGGDDD